MKDHRNRSIIAVLLAVALGVSACSTSVPKQTGLLAQTDEVDISNRELHMLLYGYAYMFSGTVEVAADSILTQATDSNIRKNAILWKLNSVPIVQGMTFEPDPLYSFFGIWVFVVQMRQYFETGVGKDQFGQWQPIAIRASRKLENAATNLARSIKVDGNIDAIHQEVQQWSTDHPIKNSSFVREQIHTELIVRAGQASAASVAGGLSAAASMNAQMQELSNQLAMANTAIPKMAQWHAEMLMEEAPELIAREREAVMTDLQNETQVILQELMAFGDRQRVALIADLSEERTATLKTAHEDLLLLLSTAEKERIAVIEALGQERLNTLEQLNTITLAAVRAMITESESLTTAAIDRVFWRVIQVMALPFLGLILFISLLMWMLRNALTKHFEYKESLTKD